MATASTYLDTRRKLQSGTYPVKITLYDQRKITLVSTDLTTTKAIYKRFRNNTCNTTDARKFRDDMNVQLGKANEVLNQLKTFTPDGFKKLYYSTSGIVRKASSTNLRQLYMDKMERLKADLKFNTRSNYSCSLNNVLAYAKSMKVSPDDLTLEHITVDWLKGYERWNLTLGNNNVADPDSKNTKRKLKYGHPVNAVRAGNSIGTVRCYIRTLRCIFNDAVADRLISPNTYPFGKRMYAVGGSSSTKKVLTQQQLSQLRDYGERDVDGSTPYLDERDFWFFLYYANGMNCMDALHLKKSNIHKRDGEEFIRFTRKKTEFSKKEANEVEVHIKPEMKWVMDKYLTSSNPYIFGILSMDMSPEQKHNAVCNFKKQTNVALAKLGKILGFHLNLKMARSSFATELRNAGVPVAFISKMMAHSSQSTTEVYLSSLPSDQLVSVSNNLNNFHSSKKDLKKMRKAIDEAVKTNQTELRAKLKAV